MTALRFVHTVRYLRPVQVYGRMWFRLHRPRPDFRPAPALRPVAGRWTEPPMKRRSLVGQDQFRFLNQGGVVATSSDWANPTKTSHWLYNLHYFDDLAAEGAEHRAAWYDALIDRWIAENPPGKGIGWAPYPTSLRIVNWCKRHLAGRPLSPKAIHSLAVQARHLSRRLEMHLLGNHLFSNAKALVFAGLVFDGAEAERWLRRGLEVLEDEVPEQILPDGGHFERSPMYHAIVLEDMLDLTNLHRAYGRPEPDAWPETIGPMRRWLAAMTDPDGEIVLFNDAAFDIARPMAALEAYADRLDLPQTGVPEKGLIDLPETGYARLSDARITCFVDAAPIAPDYLPAHAHADTLGFECSVDGRRVLVDSGTSTYEAGPERQAQRGTAAHNTVRLDGVDSSEVWGGFRVARRARIVERAVGEKPGVQEVSAAHDGYRRLPGGPVHKRAWCLESGVLTIQDWIAGVGRHQVELAFHLYPGIKSDKADDGTFRLEEGLALLSVDRRLKWSIEPSTYHPEFGISRPNSTLVGRIEADLPLQMTSRLAVLGSSTP